MEERLIHIYQINNGNYESLGLFNSLESANKRFSEVLKESHCESSTYEQYVQSNEQHRLAQYEGFKLEMEILKVLD